MTKIRHTFKFVAASLLLLTTTCKLIAQSGEHSAQDAIEFLNGDRLQGTVKEINPEARLILSSDASVSEIQFKVEKISRITLSSRASAPTESGNGALIFLTNGDSITGTILGMKDDALSINSPAVGKINIQTAMISSIDPRAGFSGHYYSGPANDDKWIHPDSQQANLWRIENGKMVADSQLWIGRNIDIPEDSQKINYEFTMEWALRPSLNFYFMMPEVDMYRNNCYQLTIQSSYIRLYRRENSISRSVGYVQHLFQGDQKSKVQVLVDKSQQSFLLVIDGRPIQTWRDVSPALAGQGTGVQFLNNQSSPLTISDFRVMEWQGPASQLDPQVDSVDEDVLLLINGDSIKGTITAMDATSISLKTEFDTLPIPVKRITRATFAKETRARARRYKGDVEILLAGEGRLTLKLDALTTDHVNGYSENFGDVTMPIERVRDIRFNLYRELQLIKTTP